MGERHHNLRDIHAMRTNELYQEQNEIQQRLALPSNTPWEKTRLQKRLDALAQRIRQHKTITRGI